MRSSASWLTMVLLYGLGHPGTPLAQWPADIAPGARVRARLPEAQYQSDDRRGHLLRGRVTALSADTLYLAITDSVGSLPIPRSLIERLDVSRGVQSRGASALTRGLVTGALMALGLALIYETAATSNRTSTGTAALVGGAFGFATGAVFGAIYPHERWKSVRLGGSIAAPR